MLKSLALPGFFGIKKSEPRSIQSIKAQIKTKHTHQSIQPFWLYASYVLIAINATVLFSYLLGVNNQASTGYEIQNIQQKIADVSDQNKQLNLKISEQTSIAGIQEDFAASGYVPITQSNYLTVNNLTMNR